MNKKLHFHLLLYRNWSTDTILYLCWGSAKIRCFNTATLHGWRDKKMEKAMWPWRNFEPPKYQTIFYLKGVNILYLWKSIIWTVIWIPLRFFFLFWVFAFKIYYIYYMKLYKIIGLILTEMKHKVLAIFWQELWGRWNQQWREDPYFLLLFGNRNQNSLPG